MHAKTRRIFIANLKLSRHLAMGVLTLGMLAGTTQAQDWIHTTIGNGVDKIRIAAADFKPVSGDPGMVGQMKQVFDSTLYSDLGNAGIFDLVSKSMQPGTMPGSPQEMNLSQWAAAPTNAAMVAFGAVGMQGDTLVVRGWLFDAKNAQSAQVLGKQYTDAASVEAARLIAHKFADEIIVRLGAGVPGIAESHLYFVHAEHGTKEIWTMDYDGQGARALTHLGAISLSPRISPDGNRLAFSSIDNSGSNIHMYSMLLGRMVAYANMSGTNMSPAWSPDGQDLAFSSSSTGDPEIWIGDISGNSRRRVTNFRGPDMSPVWNPRSGSQIAWISGRTGLPQVYMMDSDGTNVSRMTDGGYATSPSWSPDGQFLAFAWNRKYGPGAPGGTDIYVMEIASRRWIQLTHDIGVCDFPTWSPDGRHIAFQSSPDGRDIHAEIWTMLADGTDQHKITGGGGNTMPNWSWH
jgi:TolB protein